ncbi:MAG: hypothetical protein ISR77_33365 [Pirellulaceae bacterium]|nr:hypothetical protein [Pirellulaceae bacterium]
MTIHLRVTSIAILAVLSCRASAEVELLRNNGFEGAFREGIAEDWLDNSRTWADLDVEYTGDQQDRRSGCASQRITCSRLDYGAVQFIPSVPVPLVKGRVFRVRGWLRGDVGVVALQLRQAPTPYRVYVEQGFRVGEEWRQAEYLWTSTVDDPNGRFMLRFVKEGSLWVDDLSVHEVTIEEAKRLSPAARAGNLLDNGNFDLHLANWLVNHGCDYWREAQTSIVAVDGDPCLNLTVPDGITITLASDVTEVSSGHPIHVSCRVRAAAPAQIQFGSTHCGMRSQVDTNWRMLTASGNTRFMPQANDHARFVVTGPATLWIDDVVLRQDQRDDALSRFRAAILPDRHPLSFYHDDDHPELRLMASAPESAAPRRLTWSIEDFWATVRMSGEWQPAGGRQEEVIPVRELGRGWYRASVTWKDDGPRRNEATFAILPPPERTGAVLDSPFGAHFAVDPSGLAVARAVGVRWLRLHPPNHTKWRIVEPRAKGQWQWRDEPIALARRAGLQLVGSLDRCPTWASTAPPGTPDFSFYTGTGAWLPRDWGEWETYVTNVVRRYKHDIHVWEVWNEPNLSGWLVPREGQSRAEAYVEMLRHTYGVVKREDPDATVIGGCVAGALAKDSPAEQFTWQIIDLGALELMDVFSFHQYITRSVDETSEPIHQWLEKLRAKMRAAGRELPIINSEGGYANPGSSLTYRPCPADTVASGHMARWLVRQYVSQLAAGVRQFFFYNFFIDGSPKILRWQGFLEGDGQPRPNVAAYAQISWILDGARFLRTDRPTENAWVHYFQTPRGPVAIAWARTGQRATLRFPKARQGWDLMGAPLALSADTGLTITDAPIYLLLAD